MDSLASSPTSATAETATAGSRARKALLLANSHARRVSQGLSAAIDQLQAIGLEVRLEKGRRPRDFRSHIQRHGGHSDLVIVAGGDGTLNAAAEGIVEAGLPLGVLPLGTANDLARTLGLPTQLDAACQAIAAGHTRQIDVGWVNGKHFFNVASIGLSVSITAELSGASKRRWGVLAYLITAARVLRRSRPFHAEIGCGGTTSQIKTVQITVGNGRFYGGGNVVAQHAAIDDQVLDLYSLEIGHWWQMVWLARALRTGCLAGKPCVRTISGQEFQVRTHRRRAINTDGEITAFTPATFRVVPKAVSVFVPEPQS
jgi:YegS/Rv2252/BmrU family lipid kinase